MKNSELSAQLVDSFDGPLTLGSRRWSYQKAVDERETGVSRSDGGFPVTGRGPVTVTGFWPIRGYRR